MNRFFRWLKEKRNKILAVGFASLAMAAFLGYYLLMEFAAGWMFFRSSPIELWSFAIILITYGLLLICNIRNDSFAYQGILMFVFYTAFGAFMDLLQGSISAFMGGQYAVLSFTLFFGFLAAELVLGVMLYLYSLRYMRGYSVPWRRIRLLAILFAALLTTYWLIYPIYAFLLGEWSLMDFFALPLSEAFIGWCIVFTLERLRRY
ncbi:MAG: hypothetical protein J6038_04680 [Bacilli bacterium]|nr:hypothetical protein [Bacilli bacterium]